MNTLSPKTIKKKEVASLNKPQSSAFPVEWGMVKLSKYTKSVVSGVSVNSEDRPKREGEYGILKTSSVSDGVFDPSQNKRITNAVELERAKLHPIKGRLLISRMNTPDLVGACAFVHESRDDLYIPDRLWLVEFDSRHLNAQWLNYLLNSVFYKTEIKNRASGTSNSMKNISKESFLGMYVPLPPIKEQDTHVDILLLWDKAIHKTQKLIDQIKLRNKGLAQQLLTGKRRLQGFEAEWKKVKFSDIAERIKRKNEELNDTVVTISAQRGFVLQEEFFSKRVASEILSNYYLIHRGEFAYNKSYSNGYPMGAFKRLENHEKAVVTTLYICFKLNEKVDSDFMTYFFEAGLLVQDLMEIAQEGGRAHGLLNISLSDFFGMHLRLPDKEEQVRIKNVLSTASLELKKLEEQLCQLKEQKKGLMQKLLTGEIRVNNVNDNDSQEL